MLWTKKSKDYAVFLCLLKYQPNLTTLNKFIFLHTSDKFYYPKQQKDVWFLLQTPLCRYFDIKLLLIPTV